MALVKVQGRPFGRGFGSGVRRRFGFGAGVLALGLLLPACNQTSTQTNSDYQIGAVYPQSLSQGADGINELNGVRLAADLVNHDGGAAGHKILLNTENAASASDAPAAVDRLADKGVKVILGTYGTTQSLAATAEASKRGLTYLETGAVGDAITSRGLPGILRTVATGSTLGRKAAQFAKSFVIPGLKLDPAKARVVVMFEGDQYGSSVGYGAIDEAAIQGLNVVDSIKYDAAGTDFTQLAKNVKADNPDVILTASYLDDALAFRRAGLAIKLQVKSIIGTSSAYCRQDFGDALGKDAVGLFASDKPDESLNPAGLSAEAQKLLQRAKDAYHAKYNQPMQSDSITGFVGGWVMFHEILSRTASLDRSDVMKAALALNIPEGSEINGAGVQFAADGQADAGQNRRAASVIWEWVASKTRAVVSPAPYAQHAPVTLPITTSS